mmetsp:Transcript_41727/g.96787  ORF Transcript_41727/g.96787 Transcript_41727/m.96787 type:complete len:140 (-) Transcript_41727:48-467(-)
MTVKSTDAMALLLFNILVSIVKKKKAEIEAEAEAEELAASNGHGHSYVHVNGHDVKDFKAASRLVTAPTGSVPASFQSDILMSDIPVAEATGSKAELYSDISAAGTPSKNGGGAFTSDILAAGVTSKKGGGNINLNNLF